MDIFESVDLSFLEESESGEEINLNNNDSSLNSNEDPEQQEVQDTNEIDEDLIKELEDVDDSSADASQNEKTITGNENSKEEFDDPEIDKDNAKTSSDESSSSSLASLTSSLFEEGVLASLNEEDLGKIKTGEDLMGAIRNEIKSNEYADLTEEQKEYLDLVRQGVSYEEYSKHKSSYESYESIKDEVLEQEESKDLRHEVIKNSFLLKGFDNEKAEKFTKRSFDLGEDIDDSKSALDELKLQEKENMKKVKLEAEEKRKQIEKAQEESWKDIEKRIKTTEEIIPGIKLNESHQKSVEKLIKTPVATDSSGNPVNEVVNKLINDKDYYVKIHYLHEMTNGFKNFDKIINKTRTNVVKSLDEKLKSQDSKITTGKHREQNFGNKIDNGFIKSIDKFL